MYKLYWQERPNKNNKIHNRKQKNETKKLLKKLIKMYQIKKT